MPGIYSLKGTVKHYDWGGISFIPSLLALDNTDDRPFAEYWMGVHPLADCIIETEHGEIRLNDYLAENPILLETDVQKTFGRLPYLLKVLDVKNMLSIQVHPSKETAGKEFTRENTEDIPLDSPKRNYKDDNHKPELMLALSDFWLLHGFKPEEQLEAILNAVPEFNELLELYQQSGYEGLYQMIMKMPQEDVNRILQPLIDRIIPLYYENSLEKNDENFWAARAFLTFNSQPPTNDPQPLNIDRGIFSIYLFNLLQLKKGEAVFQGAGVPHAYLEGQNVEIMANSDNVLRGGLTNKHIDVKELLKNVKCEPTIFEILKGKELTNGEKIFETPAPDFQLSMFGLKTGDTVSFVPTTAEDILLITDGTVKLDNGVASITLQKGNPSAIVFPDQAVHLHADSEVSVYRATVPGLHS